MSDDATLATKQYRGRLRLGSWGEGDDILFLDTDEDYPEPLAKRIADDMDDYGRFLSVRYWSSDAEQSDDDLRTSMIRELYGGGDGTEFSTAYSEITGYLWTNESIEVGGHDLLAELTNHVGQWCLLEIGYSREGK